MMHAAGVREWRNCAVVDTERHKIGVLEGVYVDADDCVVRTAL
ncbi:hypothetical protein [Streptomyces sp. NPDC051665]